jgi:hypothetical protein
MVLDRNVTFERKYLQHQQASGAVEHTGLRVLHYIVKVPRGHSGSGAAASLQQPAEGVPDTLETCPGAVSSTRKMLDIALTLNII